MKHQGWHPNRGEHVPDIQIAEASRPFYKVAWANCHSLPPSPPLSKRLVTRLAWREQRQRGSLAPMLREKLVHTLGFHCRRTIGVVRSRGHACERAVENERIGSIGIGGGKEGGHRATLRDTDDRGMIRTHSVHHRAHVVHPLLQRGCVGHSI